MTEHTTTEIIVIDDACSFVAQLLMLQKRDSSCSFNKITDKLLELLSWILLTISFTELICKYSGLSKMSREFVRYWASLSSRSVIFYVRRRVDRCAVGCIALHSLSYLSKKHYSNGCKEKPSLPTVKFL